jgi:hypothetical protein
MSILPHHDENSTSNLPDINQLKPQPPDPRATESPYVTHNTHMPAPSPGRKQPGLISLEQHITNNLTDTNTPHPLPSEITHPPAPSAPDTSNPEDATLRQNAILTIIEQRMLAFTARLAKLPTKSDPTLLPTKSAHQAWTDYASLDIH